MGFGSILKLVTMALSWFGLGDKSDATEGLEKGEQLGQAETRATADDNILHKVSDANAARQSVHDAPANELRNDDGFRRD